MIIMIIITIAIPIAKLLLIMMKTIGCVRAPSPREREGRPATTTTTTTITTTTTTNNNNNNNDDTT